MKWTDNRVTELRQMCMDEKSNADMAKHFGVPVTEIHAKRSQLGITMPKVAAMKGKPLLIVEPEFEAAVQEMEAKQTSPEIRTTPELTTEQAKKLLTAIFADVEDAPDEEPIPDNYPDTDHEKVGYSEYVLTHSLQYIGKAIHRLSRLYRLMALPELPDIIKQNELRMALEPLLQVENDVKDIAEMLVAVYKETKQGEAKK